MYARNLAVAGALLAHWSLAQAIPLNDDFTLALEAGAFSDYRSRGISQTQGDPALQGSATLMHSSGLYAGIWSSNVDFGFDSKTRQEIDTYAGYYWQMSDKVALDLAYFDYAYPKEGGLNYSEYFAELSAYGARLGSYYSDDVAGEQNMLYSYVGYNTILPAEVGLELRYGVADYKDPVWISSSGSTRESYDEWEVKLSRTLVGMNWTLSYIDTDLSDAECANYMGFDDVCSSTLVAGVSKAF
ncbi:TorF family putative porin [Metapseudomonas boanensis]|uniref:TorF family putative porin n=1 Tax=Metapseudomonas boanensis TaxID=2822138 RepID=A0ABS5XGY1_9GAMM|nr:TorF family putative porin [Pseudomonas boanensis]MBT8766944.1 TorF family putative porin [Pseudomonas boanensis]